MDYLNFVRQHQATAADITIACSTCAEERASEYGLMKIGVDNDVLVSSNALPIYELSLTESWHGKR